jgi:hypothetical protein
MSNAGTTLQRRQGPEAQTHKIDRPIHPAHPLIKEGHQMIYTSPEGILSMRQANTVDGGRVEDPRRYIQPLFTRLGISSLSEPNDRLGISSLSEPNDRLGISSLSEPNDRLGISSLSEWGCIYPFMASFASAGGAQLLICSHAWWGVG